MEYRARSRVNSRMGHEPIHPPVTLKIDWRPELSFRQSNNTATLQNVQWGAPLMDLRLQTSLLPAFQDSHSASFNVPSMSRPASVQSTLEDDNVIIDLLELATVGIVRTAIAPFERVKLLLQNQNAMIKSGRLLHPYNGIFNCFARTIRNEGFFSLWRGNTGIALGYFFNKALRFITVQYVGSQDLQWTYIEWLAANCLSTAANAFLIHPLFYAGTRLANDVKTIWNKRQFNGVLDVYRKTLRSDGIAGIYRGYKASLAQVGLTTTLVAALEPWHEFNLLLFQDNIWAQITAKVVFSVCPYLVAYPLDTVSRRMMMTSGEAVKYKGLLNAFGKIFKTEGVKSFYKGAGAEILEDVALNGYMFLIFYLAGLAIVAVQRKLINDDEDEDDDDDDHMITP